MLGFLLFRSAPRGLERFLFRLPSMRTKIDEQLEAISEECRRCTGANGAVLGFLLQAYELGRRDPVPSQVARGTVAHGPAFLPASGASV